MNDLIPGSEELGILVIFEKKAVSWDLTLDEASWDSDLGVSSCDLRYAPRFCLGQWVEILILDRGFSWGVDWRAMYEQSAEVKIVFLSPRVEKTKIQKKLNVWYQNYRESSVFRVFRDSYAYDILHIRIFV